MLVSLPKNQVNYLGKSPQINSLRGQNHEISWSLFNKKSPLDRDKSHLCACMIPNWYFESPVALVWSGLPLAPDAPDPLHFSFNHSVMSISQDNKGTIPVSCAAHDVASHWSLTPPKEQSATVKLPSNCLHLTKDTAKRKKNRNSIQSPLSPVSKMAGQLIHHLNARPRLVIVFATKAFRFTIQLS